MEKYARRSMGIFFSYFLATLYLTFQELPATKNVFYCIKQA